MRASASADRVFLFIELRETKIKMLSLRFIRPPAHIIDEFGISDEQLLCHMVRIRSNRNLPFAYYESWSLGFNKSIRKQALEKPRGWSCCENPG